MSHRREPIGAPRRARLRRWSVAPDGRPRPNAPFGRGPLAAHVLGRVIDGAAWAGSRLPSSVTHALAVAGGNAEWALRPGKRRQLAGNLAHALGAAPRSPAVRQAVRAELVNEARRSADLLWAIGRPQEFIATVEIRGAEHLAGLRGIVLAGVHLGGWEVAAAVPAAVVPVPTSVIVADNWLAWGIQHVRAAAGLQVVYRSQPALAAARLLRRGEALLVLGDDATGTPPRRYAVRFLDSSAELPAGVVSLARLAGASIVPFSVLPLAPRRWQVTIERPIPPPARAEGSAGEQRTLQLLADRWTAQIAANPRQWAASFPIAWTEP